LCKGIRIFKISLRYSFICQGNSIRRQRRDLFGFRVKLPPVTTSLTTQSQRHGRRTAPWIFIHGTDIVESGLILLFFCFFLLFFVLFAPPPWTFFPTTLGGGNPVKCLVQGYNKRTCRPIFTLSLFYAKRQAGKL